ncbi:MAG: hypothetical protein MK135_13240, partial [Polyangiaceae bacterium]|nr:hypothetical protein [Polyangiaceae bacterium]
MKRPLQILSLGLGLGAIACLLGKTTPGAHPSSQESVVPVEQQGVASESSPESAAATNFELESFEPVLSREDFGDIRGLLEADEYEQAATLLAERAKEESDLDLDYAAGLLWWRAGKREEARLAFHS